MATMVSFEKSAFRYEPFPYATIDDILPPHLHEALARDFPPVDCFRDFSQSTTGPKSLLKEPELSAVLRKGTSAWSSFVRGVYEPAFLARLDSFLSANGIEMELTEPSDLFGGPARRSRGVEPNAARGYQKPHTDILNKMLTLLIPMNEVRKPRTAPLLRKCAYAGAWRYEDDDGPRRGVAHRQAQRGRIQCSCHHHGFSRSFSPWVSRGKM